MAQLIFYDAQHIYEVDGVRMTSISEILRFLSREAYEDVNQFRLDNAADRGTAVHTACEVLYKYRKVECTPEIEPYIHAFVQFLKDHQCDFTEIEKPLADVELGIAGTPDFCGAVDGVESIIDLKAQSSIKKTLVKAQLNAYRHLRIVNKKPIPEQLYCLQLLDTGKYRFYPAVIDETEFMACLTLHKALKAKHERGRIN